METIKIKAATIKKQTDTFTIRQIETEDGKKYDTFDDVKEGTTVSGEIVPNKNEKYNANFKLDKPGKKFPVKDWTADKRMSALTNSVNAIKLTGKEVTSKNILALAEEFFKWLNTK